MIKKRYKLFPRLFIKKVINIIRMSENNDVACERLSNELGLNDLEIKYLMSCKVIDLIEHNLKDGYTSFMSYLCNIHFLEGNIEYDTIVKLLNERNISFREYECSDKDFLSKKGSKLNYAFNYYTILEITNPNHKYNLEIQIDKISGCLIDLWFGPCWFEYEECKDEQSFVLTYINDIEKIKNNKLKIIVYHFEKSNMWIGTRCFYKDEVPEFDETENLEKTINNLKKNKKIRNQKIRIDVFDWETLETFYK